MEAILQKLTRWGGSAGLRLPAAVIEAAGLKVGDSVYVRLLDSGDIRLRPCKAAQIVPVESDHKTSAKEDESQW
jgi:antitoxin component of MazEF toxin-antitoxin module